MEAVCVTHKVKLDEKNYFAHSTNPDCVIIIQNIGTAEIKDINTNPENIELTY